MSVFNVRNVLLAGRGLEFRRRNCESTYAKSFIKLPLDEADTSSLKLTNQLTTMQVDHRSIGHS